LNYVYRVNECTDGLKKRAALSKYRTATVVIVSTHICIIAFKGLDIIHVN